MADDTLTALESAIIDMRSGHGSHESIDCLYYVCYGPKSSRLVDLA